MDKVITSFEQLNGLFAKVRETGERPLTNFFWDENKHPFWLEAGTLRYQTTPGCVLLTNDNGEFLNLFYFASGADTLKEALSATSLQKQTSLDIVSKAEAPVEMAVFQEQGFESYKRLYRMSHIGQLPFDPSLANETPKADNRELEIVRNMLYTNFDPLSEQIPTLYELNEINQKGGVIVYKEDQEVCGFSIFEDKGLTWYWRYWFVSEQHRNKGIGSKLYNGSVKTSLQSKRQILWVIDDNENAIKRHTHFGFRQENLFDYVLLKNKL